jgi:hypothetical protein
MSDRLLWRRRRGEHEDQKRETAESNRQGRGAVDQGGLERPARLALLSRITEGREHGIGMRILAGRVLIAAPGRLPSQRVKNDAHGSVSDRGLESDTPWDGPDATRVAS